MIPNDLSSVSRTHITEEETQFPQVILRPIHTSTVALVSKQASSRAPPHTHTLFIKLNMYTILLFPVSNGFYCIYLEHSSILDHDFTP